MIDLLITNGTILDGTGAPPFGADVLIENGRITDIIPVASTDSTDASRITHHVSRFTLDADRLFVTPGLIDIHSHSDFTLLVDPRAVSSITQGVTLEVIGNCGHGCAPIANPALVTSNIYGYRADYDLNWRTMAEYLARLEEGKPAVNVATLVPNGNLRLAAAGLVDRPSTPDQLKRMKKLLAQSLEEGAFGFSTGLEYGPEKACTEEEIVELCRVAADAGGFYATHTRNRDGEAHETIAEAIRTSAAAHVPLQISHLSVVSRLIDDGRWAVEQAIEQVDEARARGLDVGFDMHTRLFGTTNLSVVLPPWALEGDKAAIAARLRDPAVRRKLKTYRSIITALARGDWSKIILFDSKNQPDISRKSIAEISAQQGVDPLDAIYDILLAEIDDPSTSFIPAARYARHTPDPPKAGGQRPRRGPAVRGRGHGQSMHSLMVIAFAYKEDDSRIAFEHPLCMVGSDATALATDGPLAGTSFHGAYTWAAWFFRHFVRDTKFLNAQEAIRRLTSLPASRLGLKDRGVIRKGACADLAIFDPATFAERGTTFEPNQVAAGMKHVLVNGIVMLNNGTLTGERGGRVLRRA